MLLRSTVPAMESILDALAQTELNTVCVLPGLWDAKGDGDILGPTTCTRALHNLVADDAAEGIGLKISKNGGLSRGRRHLDICVAGVVPSACRRPRAPTSRLPRSCISETVPEKNLRCLLECWDMVPLKTADGACDVHDERVSAPTTPDLGGTPRLEALAEPVASYSLATGRGLHV